MIPSNTPGFYNKLKETKIKKTTTTTVQTRYANKEFFKATVIKAYTWTHQNVKEQMLLDTTNPKWYKEFFIIDKNIETFQA